MFRFSRTLALSAGLLSLCLGQSFAFASDCVSLKNDGSDQQGLCAPAQHSTESTQDAIVLGNDSSLNVGFFPELPSKDVRELLAKHLFENCSILKLALVNKGWYAALLKTDFITKEKSKWTPILSSNESSLLLETLREWIAKENLQTLSSGNLRYQPKGKDAINIPLAPMFKTNGDLVFPEQVEETSLCVTRSLDKFVTQVPYKDAQGLVLLLTLSELRMFLDKIPTKRDAFKKYVNGLKFSELSVCLLTRNNGDSIIDKYGFTCSIMKFRDINGLSIFRAKNQRNNYIELEGRSTPSAAEKMYLEFPLRK